MRKNLFYICIIAIITTACSQRDISTLPKALHGHWISHGDEQDTHYYIDNKSLTMIDGSRRMEMTYVILESSEIENWIKVRVKTNYDSGHDKLLKLYSEKNSLIATIKTFDSKEFLPSSSSEWLYIDSMRKPKK